MITEKQVYKITYELEKTIFTFRDPIIEIYFKEDQLITMDDYAQGIELLNRVRPNSRFCFLYVFGDFSMLTPELRSYAASNKANRHTIADAIVVKSLSQRLLVNFYIRFNKPIRPTRAFTDRLMAEEWLHSFCN